VPEPWLSRGLTLQERARDEGLTLRLFGSIAILSHAHDMEWLKDRLDRPPYHDVDFVGRHQQFDALRRFFESQGFVTDPALIASQEYGVERLVFLDPITGDPQVDLMSETVRMCHVVDLHGRLELESVTIPVSDLVLTKLQIVELNPKDVIDLVLLLASHDVAPGSRGDAIDGARLATVLGRDWGFSYTAHRNLDAVDQYVASGPVTRTIAADVAAKTASVRQAIDGAQKTIGWRMRSAIGTRLPWYETVEEVRR